LRKRREMGAVDRLHPHRHCLHIQKRGCNWEGAQTGGCGPQ
jgi:hypothetical protein